MNISLTSTNIFFAEKTHSSDKIKVNYFKQE